MYLLEEMLPYYIKIIEAYIKNKHSNFIIRAIMPNEDHLAHAKKTLAIDFLSLLHNLNRVNNVSDLDARRSIDEVSSAAAKQLPRGGSLQISEAEVATHCGASVDTVTMLATQLPLDSPSCSSFSSYRRRNNTEELRNASVSVGSINGVRSDTFDGGSTAGDFNAHLDIYSILQCAINDQIEKCIEARRQHKNHKPGSYDLILQTMQENLSVIEFRSRQMAISHQTYKYKPQSDLQVFDATYRNNLHKSIYVLLCILSYDLMLCCHSSISNEQKALYTIGNVVPTIKSQAIASEVGRELLTIAKGIFSPDYVQTQQFLKTLADYTLTLRHLRVIYSDDDLLLSRLESLKSDLIENYTRQFPFIINYNSVEKQIEAFIMRNNGSNQLSRFSLDERVVLQEDDPYASAMSPYPTISRM